MDHTSDNAPDDRHRCIVQWHMGTYSGDVTVYVDPNAETDVVIAKARRLQRRDFGPSLGMAYESWKVFEREPVCPAEEEDESTW